MSPIIEVLIGLIFVFILLSILVTEINSIISNVTRLRARHLRKGISLMIEDPEMRARIITHPLVQLVEGRPVLPGQKLTKAEVEKIVNGTVTNLSNIDPKTFVDVLIDLIRVDSDQELYSAMLDIVDGMPAGGERRRLRLAIDNIVKTGNGLDDLHEAIAMISNDVYRSALNKMLNQINKEIERQSLDGDNLTALIAGIRKMTNPYLKSALKTILATSYSVQEAQASLQKWFNEGMERASASFTRNMQALSLASGLFLAVLLNVDVLQLARTLWEDPALREALVATVENTDLESLIAEDQAQQAELQTDTASGQDDTLEDITGDIAEDFSDAQAVLAQFLELRLPIGWTYEVLSPDDPAYETKLSSSRNLWNLIPGNNPDWMSLIIFKIAGLLGTMFAIAQGAPFWFNIIRRLTGR